MRNKSFKITLSIVLSQYCLLPAAARARKAQQAARATIFCLPKRQPVS